MFGNLNSRALFKHITDSSGRIYEPNNVLSNSFYSACWKKHDCCYVMFKKSVSLIDNVIDNVLVRHSVSSDAASQL